MLKNINHVKIVSLIIWAFLLVGFSNYVKYPSIFYPEYQVRTLDLDWFDLNNELYKNKNTVSALSKTDELSESGYGEPFKLNEYEQKIWSKYLQICPKSLCHKITKFKVGLLKGYAYPETTPTRTEVELINPVLDRWVLRTDIAATRDLDYQLTLQIGYIVGLNNTQVDQTSNQEFLEALGKESECKTYYSVYEGCSFENSHINLFYNKFPNDNQDYRIEDFAETFANFFTKPQDDKISSKKISWMYEQKELIEIRNEMFQNLGKK